MISGAKDVHFWKCKPEPRPITSFIDPNKRVRFYNEEIGTKDTGTLTTEAIKSEALLLLFVPIPPLPHFHHTQLTPTQSIVGSDTTSTAMQALLIGILSTPHIQTRVMAELSTLPTYQTAQYDTVLSSCPYYISCVKEAIRLTPSAPTYFPRHPPAEGLDICGTFVPGGQGDAVEVGANPYITQRNNAVYGADADEFRPERWLESGEETVAAMERYEFTFGYGSRGCIGKSLAFLELYKSPVEVCSVLASLGRWVLCADDERFGV